MKILEITPLDGERGLRLVGELDLHSVPDFREAVGQLNGGGHAKLDVSELTFIDSSGLHAIAQFAGAENGNGRVILEGVSARMRSLLEISMLAGLPRLEIRADSDGD